MAETALPDPIAIGVTVAEATILFEAATVLPAPVSVSLTVVAPDLASGTATLVLSPVSIEVTVPAPDFRFALQTAMAQVIHVDLTRPTHSLIVGVPSTTPDGEAQGRGYWYTPGNFFNGSHGVVAGSTYLYGIVHFAGIPHTDHSWLTNATLDFDELAFPFTGTIAVDVCICGEAVPSTASYSKMEWAEIGSFSFTTASSATMNLRRVSAGYGGTLSIPNALQGAWSRSNGTTLRSLTFRLRQTAGDNVFLVEHDLVMTTISLTTTTSSLPQHGVPTSMLGRSVEDPPEDIIIDAKTGVPMPAGEAVKDGFTGAIVHPDNYDPLEPRRRRSRHPDDRSRIRG